MLRAEVERHAPWWAWLGAICGAGIGFIVANIPGLMFGMYAGNRLGAIRDDKGKSVAAVFGQLGGDQKAQVACPVSFSPVRRRILTTPQQILRALAAKVLGTAASSF